MKVDISFHHTGLMMFSSVCIHHMAESRRALFILDVLTALSVLINTLWLFVYQRCVILTP